MRRAPSLTPPPATYPGEYQATCAAHQLVLEDDEARYIVRDGGEYRLVTLAEVLGDDALTEDLTEAEVVAFVRVQRFIENTPYGGHRLGAVRENARAMAAGAARAEAPRA